MAQSAYARDKVLTLQDVLSALEDRQGQCIVLTNGCFDLLHVGHVRSLEYAASLGSRLIVGINDDASVQALKGSGRPLLPAAERAELIAALACVDMVTMFAERTAEHLAAAVKPDVYVKGGDYGEESLPEAAIVRAHGGRVVLAPLIDGRSTSLIIEQIRSAS
ncbi:MAG: adenylyltransferase/cytidyltransferase family protein [Chloroflexota bacterium]